MGRMATYVLIISAFMIVFYIGGLIPENSMINILLNPETLRTNLYLQVLTTMGSIGIGTAIVTSLAGKNELAALIAFTTLFGSIILEFFSIYTAIASYNKILAFIVISPLCLLLILTVLEWWRGRD